MLDKSKSLRIERQSRKSGGPRLVYIFKCKLCSNELKVRSGDLKNKKDNKCWSCSQRKRPFESLYNGLKNDHRKIKIELTYEQYLDFTKIKYCTYCLSDIPWIEYSRDNGKYESRAYFLDRIDNNGAYSKKNCVVCCSKCNRARGNRYSFEEWFGMTEYFRENIL